MVLEDWKLQLESTYILGVMYAVTALLEVLYPTWSSRDIRVVIVSFQASLGGAAVPVPTVYFSLGDYVH